MSVVELCISFPALWPGLPTWTFELPMPWELPAESVARVPSLFEPVQMNVFVVKASSSPFWSRPGLEWSQEPS